MRFATTIIRVKIFALLVVLAFSAKAQHVAVLSGRVASAEGDGLQYASVVAVNLSPVKGTRSDDKGRYSLALPIGEELRISVMCAGYEKFDTLMRFDSGDAVSHDFVLRRLSSQLEVVRVTDEKTRVTTFTAIGVDRLESAVGPQEGVEALLKTLPDVSSNNELSSQYSVRGGSFDENLVYINGVEVLRPLLVRNGQQEGMSIINPYMVDNILFSPGGFDATYGDRMASVLDIRYRAPYAQGGDTAGGFRHAAGQASLSLLGASLSLKGQLGDRLSYAMGLRQHSNRYVFRSLDTKGNYTTSYSDWQTLLNYRVNDKLDIQMLGILSRNVYGLIPESQTTTFGGFQEVMQFEVFYEGEERDKYNTAVAALTADYHPSDDMSMRWTTSFQRNRETETYDILGQFMLYELNVGNVGEDGNTERFDRGIGSYLEHARNYLTTNIFATELRGVHYARMGNWNWGVKLQYEQVGDRMREWKLVDSAGYAMPTIIPVPGNDSNMPQTPMLQLFCRSNHVVGTGRFNAFVQRNVDLYSDRGDLFSLVAGLRVSGYDIYFGNDDASATASNYQGLAAFDESATHNRGLFVSPRLSLNYKPKWEKDILFRLATGIYSQAPIYREYRSDDGRLNHAIKPQKSYQATCTMDWNFRLNDSPFKFTADIYYKYITDLIAYRINNLRVRYDATNNAVGYAAGLSLRLSGEVVEGLESWASLSLMRTEEDILDDAYGWLPRPTDQRVSFKIFFQDYVPSVPFWRMSLNFIVGSGLPFTFPSQNDISQVFRYPAYFRVDWGNTLQLSRIGWVKDSWLMRHVDDILLSVEMFNIFDYKNVVSCIFVADYDNRYYPVPNYLTARQLNFKLTVNF